MRFYEKIDSCNIHRSGVSSFTLCLLEESVLEIVQAELCTSESDETECSTECHRLQHFSLITFYKICGHVVHFCQRFCRSDWFDGMYTRSMTVS